MTGRRRGRALAAALLVTGAIVAPATVATPRSAWAATAIQVSPARPHPTPTPKPTPTPPPTPPPTPRPNPSPLPTPSPPPTPLPSASPTPAPTEAPLPDPGAAAGALPFTGVAQAGSAQAVAIAPTTQGARTAADSGAPGDTPNLFLWFTLAIMAIPILLTMTLLATVLTRR